ncbi:MAG: pantoate--beta-alanine ligase [Planctomycetes bacterium]|jgi:pantoate--beta-alanine ligase|nr:pantoate--beta-alanine ligase [Planctomycetota bacterium]
MIVMRSQEGLRRALADLSGTLGFVPTMGALHEGHLSLVTRARSENGGCAVSLFVNPLQFDDAADYEAYPDTEAADLGLLEAAGVDVVLVGNKDDLYPPGFATRVDLTGVTDGGEGGQRPGHFQGVCTVVAKLFGLFWPQRAYFGWKDMQQLCVIRRLVKDLSMPIELVPCEIVREADGLALSSRNRRLDASERAAAPRLYRGLCAARELWHGGERAAAALVQRVFEELGENFPGDYVEVRDTTDYALVHDPVEHGRIVAAARLGATRLLDNVSLS